MTNAISSIKNGRYSPVKAIDEIDPFDFLFRNILSNSPFAQIETLNVDYPMDIGYDDKNTYINIPIIGGHVEDISITKSSDELQVSYHKQKKDDNITWKVQRITKRDFEFSWKVSPKWDIDNLKSTYIDGLLKITIPFKQSSLKQTVKILTEE